MDFLDCVKTRRSVRSYAPRKVEKETLERIVQAAACAPSWKNTQTTRYIAVLDEALKDKIAAEGMKDFAFNQKNLATAPCVVVVATITARSGFERDGSFSTPKGTHWESFDAGIATQTFCLAAHSEGLATVIMGIYDEAKVAELVGLPEGQKISALVALGYPAETPEMPKRKTTEELLRML